MAKQPAKNLNLTVNSVALEDDITGADLDIKQALAVVTAISDAGPRRLVDNYDYSLGLEGNADFAASQSDATLFGLIGSTGVATAFDPTGSAAGPNDPNYDSTSMVLESYKVSVKVGGAATFNATLQGNSALARTVA